MSIIGTRPPLISETNLYELHHRARLAIKPGITGMWQVSGRSDITDFEEVVRLDKEYITNWNIGLDIKILFNGKGATVFGYYVDDPERFGIVEFDKNGIQRYHQVSTDEVYGDLPLDRPDLFFTEETPIHTSSPYSSSKAAADLLVLAYHRTYGLPVTISRCSNNYGPYHFPEKLIPLMIANALADKPLPVYGEGLNVRDWLYVEDHCKAIDLIIHKGRVGEVYNVGGHNEKQNIEIVKIICKELGKPESLITHVGDRKGHDMRYAIDPTKIHNELGWLPETKFEDGIKKTIQWYLDNREWWETIISGEYQNYYEKMYSNR